MIKDQQRSSLRLLDLPDEILEHIIDSLVKLPHRQLARESVHHLSLTCHRLQQLVLSLKERVELLYPGPLNLYPYFDILLDKSYHFLAVADLFVNKQLHVPLADALTPSYEEKAFNEERYKNVLFELNGRIYDLQVQMLLRLFIEEFHGVELGLVMLFMTQHSLYPFYFDPSTEELSQAMNFQSRYISVSARTDAGHALFLVNRLEADDLIPKHKKQHLLGFCTQLYQIFRASTHGDGVGAAPHSLFHIPRYNHYYDLVRSYCSHAQAMNLYQSARKIVNRYQSYSQKTTTRLKNNELTPSVLCAEQEPYKTITKEMYLLLINFANTFATIHCETRYKELGDTCANFINRSVGSNSQYPVMLYLLFMFIYLIIGVSLALTFAIEGPISSSEPMLSTSVRFIAMQSMVTITLLLLVLSLKISSVLLKFVYHLLKALENQFSDTFYPNMVGEVFSSNFVQHIDSLFAHHFGPSVSLANLRESYLKQRFSDRE